MNFTNQSRSHLTGKYGGVMIYMQYLVSASGPAVGSYVAIDKPSEHPQPYSPAYGDYYGTYGLRLDNLINMVIPKKDNAERYADVRNNPQLLLEGARTVISLALNYFPAAEQDADALQIARYAYGRDYHEVVR